MGLTLRIVISCVVFSLAIQFLWSESVELKNGSIITGVIVSETDDKISIKDKEGIEYIILRSLIKSIDRTQVDNKTQARNFIVTLKSGKIIKGKLMNEDNNFLYISGDSGIENKIDKSLVDSVQLDFAKEEQSKEYEQNPWSDENNYKVNHNYDLATDPMKRASEIDFGIKAGYLSPSEQEVSDIYDGGIVYGAEIILWSGSGFGGGLAVERFSAKGESSISDYYYSDTKSTISIMPITLSGYFKINSNSSAFEPYFGLGGGMYLINEKITIDEGYYTESVLYSDNAIGFHVTAGINVKKFVLETKYSSATISSEGIVENDTDMGGFNIFLGIRF